MPPNTAAHNYNSSGGSKTMTRQAAMRSDASDGPMSEQRVLAFDGEPSLEEMLDDPVVQAVMAQDGVERQELVDLVASLQSAFCR